MNKQQAIKSALKNDYIKKVHNIQELKEAVKNYILQNKDKTAVPDFYVLINTTSGVRISRNLNGKFAVEKLKEE